MPQNLKSSLYYSTPKMSLKNAYFGKVEWSLGRDLDPRPLPYQGLMFSGLDLGDFDNRLKAKFSNSYRSTMFCYARKYHHYLKPESNLREL
jgi:hypothetical protein